MSALLHVVPLNNFIGGAQRVMAERLGVPVTITNLRYALLPLPELTLERVGIGKLQEIKIESIYLGIIPFVILQLLGLILVAIFPALATWLPLRVFGS